MRNTHKAKLAALGIEVEQYYVGDEPYSTPPTWGLALKRDGRDIAVIETHGCHTDDDAVYNKYVVRSERAQPAKREGGQTKLAQNLDIYKLQREAVAAVVRSAYRR